jgi:putative oxidoreductase
MSISTALDTANGVAERTTDWLATPLLFAFRWYVAWQFLKSGWLKVSNWDSTLYLFQEEYHVPLLSPQVAAAAGTAGELVFPVLLIIGLLTRVAALGLSAVNVLGQHYLWGTLLLVVLVFGPGKWSLDAWREGRKS